MFTLDMIEVSSLESDEKYGRIQISPLERGYGYTIGNSLRRVLISSLPGAAITHIEVTVNSTGEIISHEFTTIHGLKEDMTELILNLKGVRLKLYSDEPVTMEIKQKGEGIIKAGDIIAPSEVEILNPDYYIATANEDADIAINMVVKKGKGYIPSDLNKDSSLPVTYIPIDSIFSPIKKVNFIVENTRVENMTDFEKLTFEIWTDGTITPEEAIVESVKILVSYLTKFLTLSSQEEEIIIGETGKAAAGEGENKLLKKTIEELDLSVRAYNCLKKANINTVGDLLKYKPQDLLKVRNLGRKTLKEIMDKLSSMDLSLSNDDSGGEKV